MKATKSALRRFLRENDWSVGKHPFGLWRNPNSKHVIQLHDHAIRICGRTFKDDATIGYNLGQELIEAAIRRVTKK